MLLVRGSIEFLGRISRLSGFYPEHTEFTLKEAAAQGTIYGVLCLSWVYHAYERIENKRFHDRGPHESAVFSCMRSYSSQEGRSGQDSKQGPFLMLLKGVETKC
jgi:hypothetical protein